MMKSILAAIALLFVSFPALADEAKPLDGCEITAANESELAAICSLTETNLSEVQNFFTEENCDIMIILKDIHLFCGDAKIYE